ncbi:class I SAM-dependent methyltransferase [Streptomyces sp. NPDC058486]|uniref:class I SAM-dependent methyltransferase n=1 Tax=unclassified Streptomyces TaxID=2593676 RepID=UPI003667A5C8
MTDVCRAVRTGRPLADGRGFQPLGDAERELLVRRVPALDGGGRVLDAGCSKGGLSLFLASAGYAVEAVDVAGTALARAREEHGDVQGVRWLDLERDDWAELHEEGYDLVALRLVVPFFRDRARILHALGEWSRPGGKLLIITPTAGSVPAEKRGIALDEDEMSLIASGWELCTPEDLDGLAVLTLSRPCHSATRGGTPAPARRARDDRGVRGGHGRRGPPAAGLLQTWPPGAARREDGRRGVLRGGRVRELQEETGLVAAVENAHVVAMLTEPCSPTTTAASPAVRRRADHRLVRRAGQSRAREVRRMAVVRPAHAGLSR